MKYDIQMSHPHRDGPRFQAHTIISSADPCRSESSHWCSADLRLVADWIAEISSYCNLSLFFLVESFLSGLPDRPQRDPGNFPGPGPAAVNSWLATQSGDKSATSSAPSSQTRRIRGLLTCKASRCGSSSSYPYVEHPAHFWPGPCNDQMTRLHVKSLAIGS
jgi:hypothetical protein